MDGIVPITGEGLIDGGFTEAITGVFRYDYGKRSSVYCWYTEGHWVVRPKKHDTPDSFICLSELSKFVSNLKE